MKKLLGFGAIAFVAIVLASAGNRVDSIAGDGTARDSVRFGTDTASGYVGELFHVPGQIMAEVRPEIQAMSAQAGGLLGATGTPATPAAPPVTAPSGSLNPATP